MLWAILPTILEIPSFKNTLNSYFGIELNIQWKKRKGFFFHFKRKGLFFHFENREILVKVTHEN